MGRQPPRRVPLLLVDRRQERANEADERMKSEIKQASAFVSGRITKVVAAADVAQRTDFFD